MLHQHERTSSNITGEINRIWQLSCQIYQDDKLQQLCLNWQNIYGLNVNLLLIFAIYQSQKSSLNTQSIHRAIEATNQFSQQHTQAIRKVRNSLKQNLPLNDYQAVKESVLNAELKCEALEQKACIQALFKEGGGGITPWHADQYYWPLSSDKTITAWIPLQATPLEMGPLEFSAGSHKIQEGRALSISDESETLIGDRLRVTDFPHTIAPFDLGEVSFHSGWIFHRAGANTTDQVRKVMTVIYMDQDIKLKAPENEGQQNDWDTWCPGVEIGETVNSPLNPVLFSD